MNDVTPTTTNLDPAKVAGASKGQRQTMLRQAVDELVGVTFFGEMLKIARSSRIKDTIMHGGHGEDVFAPQLDMEFAKLAGQGMQNSLGDAIYNRLARKV